MRFPKIGADIKNGAVARAIDLPPVDDVYIVAWLSLGLSIVLCQMLAPFGQPLVRDVIGALLRH